MDNLDDIHSFFLLPLSASSDVIDKASRIDPGGEDERDANVNEDCADDG